MPTGPHSAAATLGKGLFWGFVHAAVAVGIVSASWLLAVWWVERRDLQGDASGTAAWYWWWFSAIGVVIYLCFVLSRLVLNRSDRAVDAHGGETWERRTATLVNWLTGLSTARQLALGVVVGTVAALACIALLVVVLS